MTSPGDLLASTALAQPTSVLASAAATLRARVGVGPTFLATTDPTTGDINGTFAVDIPDDAAAAFYANELSGRDVVHFAALAEAAVPVQSLFSATEANPARSARWRDVIAPLGWGDELRAAIRSDGRVWGYLCLHREAGERPFGDKDVARLAGVLPVLAGALRRVALPAVAERRLETGVLVFDEHGRLTASTEAAAAWLDELGVGGPDGLPWLVAGLVRHVRVAGRSVSTTVVTRTGRHGVVEAAALESGTATGVVVVVSAPPPELRLTRLAVASGLTPREVEVLEHVVAGRSTKQIAAALEISPYTVQAHLTSVFAKTGQRSRRELIGLLRG